MAATLLDTTVVIDLLRGRPGAALRLAALREAGDAPHVCAITIEEVARGVRPQERDAAERLFRGLRLAPLGRDQGWQAGDRRREHAERGTTLAQADCLVAAAALSIGGRLATGNPKHFPMSDLSVEHWPVGE